MNKTHPENANASGTVLAEALTLIPRLLAAVKRIIKKPLPLIGQRSTGSQMKILGGGLLSLFLLTAVATYFKDIHQNSNVAYTKVNSEISMQSQRLGSVALQALRGEPQAFDEIVKARERVNKLVEVMKNVDDQGGITVKKMREKVLPEMAAVAGAWVEVDSNVFALIYQRAPLARFATGMSQLLADSTALTVLAAEVRARALALKADSVQVAAVAKFEGLADGLSQRASLFNSLGQEQVAFESDLAMLGTLAKELERADLVKGKAKDEAWSASLSQVLKRKQSMQEVLRGLYSSQSANADADRAIKNILRDTEVLLKASERLAAAQAAVEVDTTLHELITLLVVLSVISGALLAKVYLSESWAYADQVKRQLDELELLDEIGRTVSSSLDIEEVLSTIVTQAVKLGSADSGTLFEFDEVAGIFSPRANVGMSKEHVESLRDARTKVGEGVVGKAAERMGPYIVEDTLKVDIFTPVLSAMHNKSGGTRSVLGVPLLRDGKLVGGLVIRRNEPGGFAPSVVKILQTFTGQSSLAIQNAQLFDDLRKKGDELEAASQLKSQFLANMSHELRTPLNAIIGVTEMMLEDAQDLKRDDDIEPLERVLRSGRHLLNLINDILDLSKIEAGKMDLHPETFSLAMLSSDVVKTIETLAIKNGNKVVLECPDSIGSIYADQIRLRQVLLNLLSNANKFTEKGTVRVTVQRELRQGEDWIEVAVTDTGIGMTPEQLSRLFSDFVQADASTTRKYGGTGLGLAISRRLCQMMGGDIFVTSEMGQGSIFRLSLPAKCGETALPVPVRPAAVVRPAVVASRETVVLVIDDDQSVLDITERFLSRKGFKVVTADNGHDGLRLARELRPDAITLDVMMPQLDGWTVLAAIKGDPELADIPVIMMTIIDDRTRGYALGAADYLIKPVNRETLSAALRAASGTGGHKVLVVDDDDLMRSGIAKILMREGWEVVEAENGRAALECLQQLQPDVIMLDLMMPEMDGFEFLNAMRLRPEWRDIPVLVVTAKDLSASERDELNLHVERVVYKGSAALAELLSEIGDVLEVSISRRRDNAVGDEMNGKESP